MDSTTTTLIIAGALVLVLIGGALGWSLSRRRRTSQLKQRFGPEYDHTLETAGDQNKAEEELEDRAKRVDALRIHPLLPDQRERFHSEWQKTQAQFVDEPAEAVGRADALIKEVMAARGYPVADFEQRVADISVNHPNVVSNYRAARAITDRNAEQQANTEDLRQAMVYYRSLFEELLETQVNPN